MDGKPKLIALDHDVNTLRDVAAMLSPWYEVQRFREPLRAIAMIEADASIEVFLTEQVLPQAAGVVPTPARTARGQSAVT